MKRSIGKALRAMVLAMMMIAVLCVNSFAICKQMTVSSYKQIRLTANGTSRYHYVTVCNVGSRNSVRVYDIYGNAKNLQPNQSICFKFNRNETRTIYMSPNGTTSVVISGGAYQS